MKSFKVYSSGDFPSYLPKLNALYDELFSDGKGFRARLVREIGDAINASDDVHILLSQTIEFIHNASLLHDDLVDRSALRRGKPAAWLKFTPEYAVLAGDYLLARVMVNLSKFGNVQLIQYTAEMISDLLEGEWIQDSLIRDWDVGLKQLDRVHMLKTASLFKWCLRAPFLALRREDEGLHHALEEMGSILGLLFQRSDDLLDFDVRNGEGKAILGDLKSGYLNSVAAFLSQDLEAGAKKKFIQCQSLAEIEATLGSDVWHKKLQEFDQMNMALIDRYHHHCQELANYLQPQEQKLISRFQQLPDLLYWRKKP